MAGVFMQDFSALDPRSVKAQLRGTGDGREACYERFAKQFIRSHPNATEAELSRAYAEYFDDLPVVFRKFEKFMADVEENPYPAARLILFCALTYGIWHFLFQ